MTDAGLAHLKGHPNLRSIKLGLSGVKDALTPGSSDKDDDEDDSDDDDEKERSSSRRSSSRRTSRSRS